MPARILAAFLDMVMLRLIAAALLPSSGLAGFGMFILAGAYFGVGNSTWLSGSTPGKRILGLEVKSIVSGERLSLKQSLLRYLYYPGFVVLLVDLPQTYFKMNGTIASPWLLQFNMLLAFLCFFISVAIFFSGKKLRAGHDYLAKTVVVRDEGVSTNATQKIFENAQVVAGTFGASLAFILWIASVKQPPVVANITTHKYYFEKNHSLIIAGSLLIDDKLEIAIYLPPPVEEDEILQKIEELLDEMNERELLNSELELIFLVATEEGLSHSFRRNTGEKTLEQIELEQIPSSNKSPL
jgi:uncharacterized RDD family membrane protein YckC